MVPEDAEQRGAAFITRRRPQCTRRSLCPRTTPRRCSFSPFRLRRRLTGEEYWGEFDKTTGGYNLFQESYRFKDETDESDVLADRVYIPGITCGRSVIWYGTEADEWDITGERTENGRRIVSISGVHKGDNNYEGVYREEAYTVEIDAATGMTISYVTYDESEKMTYSYEVTNYKFDDEAEAFKTAEDVTNEIENGGYIQRHIGY